MTLRGTQLSGGNATDMVEITEKWKLEVEPADVTELLPSHDKI